MPTPVLPNETNQMPPMAPPPVAVTAPPLQTATAPAPQRPRRGAQAAPAEAAAPKGKKKKKGGTAAGGSGPVAEQASRAWAIDALTGGFQNNPYFQRLMDPAELDVRNNPNLQPVTDALKREMQEDWLGNLRALDARAEGQGRGGSPLAAAMRSRATEETEEALGSQLANIYAGAYENARNRQMQGLGQMMQTQAQAAGIPIAWHQADTARKGVQTQRYGIDKQFQIDKGRLGLARQEFNFSKRMQTAAAQQDALQDYAGLLSLIGGMGGTQTDMGGGTYIPTTSPWLAAGLGGYGGYLQGQETFG